MNLTVMSSRALLTAIVWMWTCTDVSIAQSEVSSARNREVIQRVRSAAKHAREDAIKDPARYLKIVQDDLFPSNTDARKRINDNVQLLENRRSARAVPSPNATSAQRVSFDLLQQSSKPEFVRNMAALVRGLSDRRPIMVPRIFDPTGPLSPTMDVLDCVSIGSPGSSCCTGTLIDDNVVVTAAHCFECFPSHVYVGWNANQSHTGSVHEIKNFIRHPGYNPSTFANDIAVIILKDPVTHVRPREFANLAETVYPPGYLVMGFGYTQDNDFGIKYETHVAVSERYSDEIAAGGFGFDTCQGDSGGPLYYVATTGTLYLVGVTSRGGACGGGGLYVRCDYHRAWIDGIRNDRFRSRLYLDETYNQNQIAQLRLKPIPDPESDDPDVQIERTRLKLSDNPEFTRHVQSVKQHKAAREAMEPKSSPKEAEVDGESVGASEPGE